MMSQYNKIYDIAIRTTECGNRSDFKRFKAGILLKLDAAVASQTWRPWCIFIYVRAYASVRAYLKDEIWLDQIVVRCKLFLHQCLKIWKIFVMYSEIHYMYRLNEFSVVSDRYWWMYWNINDVIPSGPYLVKYLPEAEKLRIPSYFVVSLYELSYRSMAIHEFFFSETFSLCLDCRALATVHLQGPLRG